MNYNYNQKHCIETESEKVLVIAGPGSGKTRVIIGRIKHQAQIGRQHPSTIVAITFTQAGAREMSIRLEAEGIKPKFVGTLHAFCLFAIRKHDPGIAVIGDQEADTFLEATAKKLRYKGTMKSLVEAKRGYSTFFARDVIGRLDDSMRVISEYNSELLRNGILDYDLILHEGRKYFSMFEGINLYVDEYQDSGDLDNLNYDRIPAVSRFYVGDPDQSIFSFRRADIRHILGLVNNPGWTKVYLQENYRSHRLICKRADNLIQKNSDRPAKMTIPISLEEGKVTIREFERDTLEFEEVAGEVWSMIESGVNANEIAVLARTNDIANQMREALNANQVKVADTRRPQPPEVLSRARAAINLAINPRNPVLIAQHKQFTGKMEDVEHLRAKVVEDRETGFANYLRRFGIGDQQSRALVSAYYHRYQLISVEDRGFLPDRWQEFICGMMDEQEPEADVSGVSVLTFHGSKGREWDHVWIVGVDNGVCPNIRSSIEEERRLLYVALTRARRSLTVSSAQTRFAGVKGVYGGVSATGPSPFLSEML